MYEIERWINARSFVPEDELNNIYSEFISFSQSPKFIPSYSSKVMEHQIVFDEYIDIPEEVREKYRQIGRFTPLHRALGLEKALNTNCQIYLKREDLLPSGSFKLNAMLPQAYFAKNDGRKTVLLATSAGQTGASGAFAAALFGLKCKVFIANHAYVSRPGRCNMMRMYGAEVVSSPTMETEIGRNISEAYGMEFKSTEAVALSEVAEIISKDHECVTFPGSFSDFTLSYNTIVGQETIKQFEELGVLPNKVVGCVGGGSSFGGIVLPFMKKYDEKIEYFGVESENVPKMTKGVYKFDYPGVSSNQYPRCKMYSLGYNYIPPNIHATGLRYHGVSPIISYLLSKKKFTPFAVPQQEALDAAKLLASSEGIITAPESSYSIAKIIREAKVNNGDVLLTAITGNGYLDLNAYENICNA